MRPVSRWMRSRKTGPQVPAAVELQSSPPPQSHEQPPLDTGLAASATALAPEQKSIAVETWIAKCDTALKKSTRAAASLADHEKHLVRQGDVIVAEGYVMEAAHHKLTGASLNGTHLEDGWFLYEGHWSRR